MTGGATISLYKSLAKPIEMFSTDTELKIEMLRIVSSILTGLLQFSNKRKI